ncbi:unnamed protein product [Rotaria sordida]|uniref:Uncharacterized protein n=1 Tax=Rotaria sordida TaxID=392033 RepID=A0A814LWC6_9BILA|nr:unnamed protein product [Rotaria sordida]
MERILLAADYPNLVVLKFFNFNNKTTSKYFTEDHRHNQIVPVRLHRAQNDEHFATATIRYMKDFASFFGNGCVFYL